MTDPLYRHNPDAPPTCTLGYIRKQLGRTEFDYSDRRMVTYVTQLIRERNFPKPLPMMKSGKLTDDVTPRSHWRREAVDAWLFDFLPPDAGLALDRTAQREAANAMDAAAAGLGAFNLRPAAAPPLMRLVGGTAS